MFKYTFLFFALFLMKPCYAIEANLKLVVSYFGLLSSWGSYAAPHLAESYSQSTVSTYLKKKYFVKLLLQP